MPLLSVTNLWVKYGSVFGTRGLSLSVEDGAVVALIGSNGAGKSSTLRAIMGLARYSEGEISLGGEPLNQVAAWQIVRKGIGFSPEGRRVFGPMSVHENLRIGGFSLPPAEAKRRLEQMLGYFPLLQERLKQRAASLSGGEQQMLAIGRALMPKPRLLLLDEPSLGLAPVMVERIGEILLDVQRQEGLAVLLAEQNAHWALAIATQAAVVELGRTVLTDTAAAIRSNAAVQQAFLGV